MINLFLRSQEVDKNLHSCRLLFQPGTKNLMKSQHLSAKKKNAELLRKICQNVAYTGLSTAATNT